jgi:hypothetical protein
VRVRDSNNNMSAQGHLAIFDICVLRNNTGQRLPRPPLRQHSFPTERVQYGSFSIARRRHTSTNSTF